MALSVEKLKGKSKSLGAEYQRLLRARALARKTGQNTGKLDRKIDRLLPLVAELDTVRHITPRGTRYLLTKEAGKRPFQGGRVSPR